MSFKVVCILALMAVVAVTAAPHGYSHQHISKHDGHHHKVEYKDHHGHHHVDYYAYPKYKFEYKVDDDHTGDHKEQHEHRD
ncbi:hypothetical protein PYW07_015486 [Mythimna separata]|uniref:Uncharacterized protein n=1 Tax=Mythimna separata TaxID=271217 RepID=A0AAD8DZW0_MYTSE|nr:hypothetical protein PYW07_015486 [Mythimna separata]